MPRPGSAAVGAQREHMARLSGKQVSVVLLSATAVLLGILLYLWPQMRLVELGYRQGEFRAQRAQALQRQTELQVELATLRQLSRIERLAVQRLHMGPPQLSQVIYVRHGPDGVEVEKKP